MTNIGRHIETIYSKVFFSRIDGLEKVIYLDSDTVVVGSLKELWSEDLNGYYMGVVETYPTSFYRELGLPQGERFFNDGMAICNVAFCRDNNLIEEVLKVVDDFNGNPPTLSEGALNKVCYGKVKYISLRYNLMAGLLYLYKLDPQYMSQVFHYDATDLKISCEHPVVIHYLTAFYNRPWFADCTHPFKGEYLKYKAMSPWKNEPLIDKPLPNKLKIIDRCYKLFGPRKTEKIRKILKLT